MASTGLPALQVNTQGESPLNMLGKIEQIKSAQQSQEMGAVQLQEARVAQQSRQALMAAWAESGGDMNKTYAAITAGNYAGKVTPNDVMNFRTNSVALQTQAAKLDETTLANIEKTQGLVANELESFKALPIDQRTPDVLKAVVGRLGTQGVDVSKILPTIQAIAQNPSDATIRNAEIRLKGEQWVLTNERVQREAASAPTVSQAQAKTAAELSKAQDEALAAHVSLLSMPPPEEAKTMRAANLLKTQAETAAANATTAQKRAETALLGAQPVIAFDPATNQRVLTTMPQANAQKLTNPVKVGEGDINKEVEQTRQFNDVQMNVSRYRQALQNLPPVTADQQKLMGEILSHKDFMGLLEKLPSAGITGDVIQQSLKAGAWNNLTAENQEAMIGYLRATGSVGAYQRALTQGGRISPELMHIEINNLPVPPEGASVGLKRLDAFQDNIDVASQGQTRVPWLPTTKQVRDTIEGHQPPKPPDPMKDFREGLHTYKPIPLPELTQ